MYCSPTQNRNQSSGGTLSGESGSSSFRLTCVNVNHVTYNYLMDNNNAVPDSYNTVNAPCYQSLASHPHQEDPSNMGGGSSRVVFSLPSSCESPMSLPAFSPQNHPQQSYLAHHPYHHQSTFPGGLFQNDNIQQQVMGGNENDFSVNEQFPLDLDNGINSSEDDGNT